MSTTEAPVDSVEKATQADFSVDETKRVLVQQTATMLILVGVIAIALALRVASLPVPALIAGLIAVGVCGGCILLARSQLSVVIGACCLIGSWLAALFAVAYMRGGLGAPLLIAVPIVPVIAATVISRSAAWIVLIAIFAGLAALTGLQLAGHAFPHAASANAEFDLMRAVWVALSSLMSTKLATYNAMRNDKLTLDLQRQALTDALTGVANRRAIIASLRVEVARSRRTSAPLSVLMLDVDRFKCINDEHGHLAGDETLVSIAGVVAEQLRASGDVIGRWGGEEFLVILPATTMEDATKTAQRIARSVAQLGIRYCLDKADVVTVTIGVAQHDATSEATADAIVHRADAAMYRGKAEGRNRIVCADGSAQANDETLIFSTVFP